MSPRRLSFDPVIAVVFFVAAALTAPFFRYVSWLGDEGVLLHGAQRMLRGEHLYRDVFGVSGPLSYGAVALWMKIAGPTLSSARVFATLTIALGAAATYLLCRDVSGRKGSSAFLAILCVLGAQGSWTVVSHHWMTTTLSLAAVVFVLRARLAKSARNAIYGGLLAGAAACVTQSRGIVLVLLVAFLLLASSRRLLLRFLAGALVVPLGSVIWLSIDGSFDATLRIARFVAFGYAGVQGIEFGSGANAQSRLLVWMAPAALVCAVLLVLQDRKRLRDPSWQLASTCALVALLTAFPRPDAVHLCFTAPLAAPLLAFAERELVLRLGKAADICLAVLAAVLSIAPVRTYVSVARHAQSLPLARLARGDVALDESIDPGNAAPALARVESLPPADTVFFYPYLPLLPYLTDRHHAAHLDLFAPKYTLPSQLRETCADVAAGDDWIFIDRKWLEPDFLRTLFPSLTDAHPPEMARFETLLLSSSTRAGTWGRYELWHHPRTTSVEACASIPGAL